MDSSVPQYSDFHAKAVNSDTEKNGTFTLYYVSFTDISTSAFYSKVIYARDQAQAIEFCQALINEAPGLN